MMRKKPELLPLDKNPADYDMIFIGTPVWAWRYAPPLSTFFSTTEITGKKIAVFCCHGGGKGKTLELMKKELEGNECIGQNDFMEPLREKVKAESSAKAADWAKELMTKIS